MTVDVDGVPAIMYGMRPEGLLSDNGIIWMLATPDMYKIKRYFIKQCAGQINTLCQSVKFIYNYVDIENKASIRWLKWLGFTFDEPIEYGVKGEQFMRFSKYV